MIHLSMITGKASYYLILSYLTFTTTTTYYYFIIIIIIVCVFVIGVLG